MQSHIIFLAMIFIQFKRHVMTSFSHNNIQTKHDHTPIPALYIIHNNGKTSIKIEQNAYTKATINLNPSNRLLYLSIISS